MEIQGWPPPHLSRKEPSERKPPGYRYRRRLSEEDEEPDISELLDWIQDIDDWDHYDVHVSGETVKMRGGTGG